MVGPFVQKVRRLLKPSMEELDRNLPIWQKSIRFLGTGGRVFSRYRCIEKCGFLAYITLLEIFPLIAVLFYLVPVFFGGELRQSVQQSLIEALLPISSAAELLTEYRAGAAAKGALSLVGLLLLSLILFYTVEITFCEIWGVKSRRSLLRSSAIFIGTIVWIPLSIGLSAFFIREFAKIGEVEVATLERYLPYILCFLFLTLAYYYIPNTKVNFFNAVAGAIVATLLWIALRALVIKQISRFELFSNLIEKVGSIPYLLVWLYFTWLVILIGTVVAYCAQNFRALLLEDLSLSYELIDPVVLLSLLYIVGDSFIRQKGEVAYSTIRNSFPLQTENLLSHLTYLERKGHISCNQEIQTYLLRQPPSKILLRDFLNFDEKTSNFFHYKEGETDTFLNAIKQINSSLQDVLKDQSLESLLTTLPGEHPSGPEVAPATGNGEAP